MAVAALALEDITVTFVSQDGGRYTALRNTTLRIAPGEFVSVVGPTGCGKSTLLNVAVGLLQPSAGRIRVFDEPFAALDIQTRQLMENELLELWSANRKSVVFITHDLEEAISLSDRVVVLSAGPEAHPIGEFDIDLPRPRDVAEIRLAPRFIELHTLIWRAMKNEVLKSYARQQKQ